MRFVQLYHTDWDHHGVPGQTLTKDLDTVCRDIDQPCAALIRDLKSRGLLDATLVVWGGEFGRTPMGEIRESIGRNHHIDAMTMWLAGGGVKAGPALWARPTSSASPRSPTASTSTTSRRRSSTCWAWITSS